MGEAVAVKPMSGELFLELIPKDAGARTVGQIVGILDAGGYWGSRELASKQKQSHVKRRLDMRTHDGTGHNLFLSWPKPFQPTLYQLRLDTYNRFILGVDENGEPIPEPVAPEPKKPGVVVSMRDASGKVHRVEVPTDE